MITEKKAATMSNLFHIRWEMMVTRKPLQRHAAGAFGEVEWRFMAFPR